MNCLICSSSMAFNFSKVFNAYGLKTVEYWTCSNCGFTISKTHAEMSAEEWSAINHAYHAGYQGSEINPDDPRWIARLNLQTELLADAVRLGWMKRDGEWLDYACGDGKLSELLEAKNLRLLKYDKYMPRRADYLNEADLKAGAFDFVITTSVFEHLSKREHFDSIENLVNSEGVLGLHTLISETVPSDPNWFYLLPVHCAFHTNKSMSILFKQWGYIASVYNVESRLWLWFKNPALDIGAQVKRANERLGAPQYAYKAGFMDYWK